MIRNGLLGGGGGRGFFFRTWARKASSNYRSGVITLTKSRKVEEEKIEETLRDKKRLRPIDPQEEKELPTFDYETENPISRIYVWGVAAFGALGKPEYLKPHHKIAKNKYKKTGVFTPVNSRKYPVRCGFAETKGVVDVACGYGFTVFAIRNQEYQLMGTGLNRDGQIGYHAPKPDRPLETIIQPLPIKLPGTKKSNISKVACGRAHTLALTAGDGEVFSMGNNAYGQCGRNIITDEDYFNSPTIHRINPEYFDNERIVSITAGQDHSIFQSESGKLYSCGWGADGQTGLGHYDNQAPPSRVEGDLKREKIVKVASAADCVLALNDKGEVFGWGNAEYGQFRAITEEQQVNIPTRLPLPGLGKIIDIASGGTICMVLNENHDLFVWGYGILGKGPDLDFSSTPSQIPSSLFGCNVFSPDVRITSINAGLGTNAAINSSGELFVWGKNRGGCLGIGEEHDQYFPLKVALAVNVKKVSLGVDHAAALCKTWT